MNQSIPGLQEDNTAIYDESSSSDNNEDEEKVLSQKNLYLDPVKKEEMILVEPCLPNTLHQALFQDPYAHFLEAFKEGIKVIRSSALPKERRLFSVAAEKQKEWEWPHLSSLPKEMKKDQSWNHLLDWLYWKREFIS